MPHRSALMSMVLLAGAPTVVASDPGDPGAAVPPSVYQSVFEGYRKYADARVESWKALNENVGQIGGWRVYLKEAHQPDPPATAPAGPAKGGASETPPAASTLRAPHAH